MSRLLTWPYPIVRLARDRARLVGLQQPWLLSGAIDSAALAEAPAKPAFVRVAGSDGRVLGIGTWSPKSPVAVRMLRFERDEAVSSAWFQTRIQEALKLRTQLRYEASAGGAASGDGAAEHACRWINSEGDRLPGIIVDRYGPAAVLQVNTGAMELARDMWLPHVIAACEQHRVRVLFERSASASRREDGLPDVFRRVWGEMPAQQRSVAEELVRAQRGARLCTTVEAAKEHMSAGAAAGSPEKAAADGGNAAGETAAGDAARAQASAEEQESTMVVVSEGRARMSVDLKRGQKTGIFLDQRENRELVARFCGGKTVLNVFGYNGGFSIHAAHAGAAHVVTLDVSEHALRTAHADWTVLNRLPAHAHTLLHGDALELLPRLDARTFDCVVCDPPAFAKQRKDTDKATEAYIRVFRQCMRLVSRGGHLWCFSCSPHMDRATFVECVRQASLQSHRAVQVLQWLGQPADHPFLVQHREGEYLKGVMLRVL